MQRSPAQPQNELMMPWAARSMHRIAHAPARGSWLPSAPARACRCWRRWSRCADLRWWNRRRLTPLMSGCLRKISASLRLVVTMLRTPSGSPASFHSSVMRMAHCGAKLAAFKHHAVAGDEADGRHPALRNHGWEVPRRDAGEDAHRLVEPYGVVAAGDVDQRLALHHLGRAAGKLDHLDDLEDVAHGLVPLLAVLLGAEVGQFVEMLSSNCFILNSTCTRLVTGVSRQAGKALAAA